MRWEGLAREVRSRTSVNLKWIAQGLRMGSWSRYPICSRNRRPKSAKNEDSPIASYNIRITLFAFLGREERNELAFDMRKPITLCGIGPRDKDYHTSQCDTHPGGLRRGGGLVLARNGWRSILSGLTQWGRYP